MSKKLTLSKDEVVNLLVETGTEKAGVMSTARLMGKLIKLPDQVEGEDLSGLNEEAQATLNSILDALEKEMEIVVVEPAERPVKKGITPRTRKAKGAGKGAVPENEKPVPPPPKNVGVTRADRSKAKSEAYKWWAKKGDHERLYSKNSIGKVIEIAGENGVEITYKTAGWWVYAWSLGKTPGKKAESEAKPAKKKAAKKKPSKRVKAAKESEKPAKKAAKAKKRRRVAS